MAHIVIIGGGITGLAAAHILEQRSNGASPAVTYTLLEAADRFGGKVVTEDCQGFVIEGGPDSFLTQKPGALALCRSLGLTEELVGAREGAYVLRGGRLHPLPSGMQLLAPARWRPLLASSLFSWPEKARIWWENWIPPRASEGDESLATLVRRRFGTGMLYGLAEPLLAGVHMADAERLSVAAAFPRFSLLERQHGSLARAARALGLGRARAGPALPPFMTLRRGMGRLIEALVERLRGDLRLGQAVEAVTPAGERCQGLRVHLQGGASLRADAVLLTTPGPVSARLLEGWRPDLAAQLRQVATTSSATISLAYHTDQVRHPLQGSGFVVPRTEPNRLMACTWTSSKFPDRAPAGAVLLRAFVGGPRAPELVDLDDAALITLVRRELGAVLGIEDSPLLTCIYRWPHAHPQYEVGHLERVTTLEQGCPPNLLLAGAFYRGIGLPDCIAQGEAAASLLLSRLESDRTAPEVSYGHL